jgi:hypothetical protein
MNNTDFWASVRKVIDDGFTPEGLSLLDRYAEQFIDGRLVYKRFSPFEQHGCAKGGDAHVIASLLAGAEDQADHAFEGVKDNQREFKQGEAQAKIIEAWAKSVGLWMDDAESYLSSTLGTEIAEGGEAKVYDHGATLIKSIGLDYYILPILALDRISLHNAYFPETNLRVIGFGRDKDGFFKIIVEQPFIEGIQMADREIEQFMKNMGFDLINPKNWTYATPDIYLSDMHDENVIKSKGGTVFVLDCDIRINTPELRSNGNRTLTTEISIIGS